MTPTTHQTTAPTAALAADRSATRRRSATVLAAAGAGLAVWALAVPVAGVHLLVQPGGAASARAIGPVDVVVAALVAGTAGWAALAVLERLAPARARAIWTVLALVVVVLTLPSALGAAVGAAPAATLLALHAAVGAVLLAGLRGSAAGR